MNAAHRQLELLIASLITPPPQMDSTLSGIAA
jgi:hypothetical protein